MEVVAIVAALALLEYSFFVFRAGQSRGRHGIAAPAMTGHPDFERNLRVQGNTLEQLVIFLPALFLFAHFVNAPLAALLGLVFVVGRGLYAHAYVRDPGRRGPGFLLTVIANLALTLGALAGATLALF
jgi:uncharacterized membrane protein YecN with MAPEG domain